jgi:glycosyltransferase involved in cell wall biosynthesis
MASLRLLWFTNILLPDAAAALGRASIGSGWWMESLARELARLPGIELGVLTAAPVRRAVQFERSGIQFFVLPEPRLGLGTGLRAVLRDCAELVQRWHPDLLHYHGTERFYPLLSVEGAVSVPWVVSLQGLAGPYSRWSAFFGDATPLEIARMHRWFEPLAGRGLLWRYLQMRRQAEVERRVLAGSRVVLGRTEWDRAYARSLNPECDYHSVGELLRSAFWRQTPWSVERCQPRRIFFSNAAHPRKGVETLLDSFAILRRRYPRAELVLSGHISERSGYGRSLRRRAGSGDGVTFLGHLGAEDLAATLATCRVFASASFIDNSPNSLCEAMLVGAPCVSSYTGGTPSLLEHNQTGLFFPPGDAEMLAARIGQLFDSDADAARLGAQARAVALARHAPGLVVRQLLGAYAAALGSPSGVAKQTELGAAAFGAGAAAGNSTGPRP